MLGRNASTFGKDDLCQILSQLPVSFRYSFEEAVVSEHQGVDVPEWYSQYYPWNGCLWCLSESKSVQRKMADIAKTELEIITVISEVLCKHRDKQGFSFCEWFIRTARKWCEICIGFTVQDSAELKPCILQPNFVIASLLRCKSENSCILITKI